MAVKSQAMYFHLAHGTSVAPFGLLPSVLMRPDGSFVQGVSAFVRALHTKSLTAKCLADLLSANQSVVTSWICRLSALTLVWGTQIQPKTQSNGHSDCLVAQIYAAISHRNSR